MTRRHDTKATSELEFPKTAIGFGPAATAAVLGLRWGFGFKRGCRNDGRQLSRFCKLIMSPQGLP